MKISIHLFLVAFCQAQTVANSCLTTLSNAYGVYTNSLESYNDIIWLAKAESSSSYLRQTGLTLCLNSGFLSGMQSIVSEYDATYNTFVQNVTTSRIGDFSNSTCKTVYLNVTKGEFISNLTFYYDS